MNKMTERELTRLSFLVDALVSSPRLWNELIGNVLSSKPNTTMETCANALKEAFNEAFASGRPSMHPDSEILRDVALKLMKSDAELSRASGQALARAIEGASLPFSRTGS